MNELQIGNIQQLGNYYGGTVTSGGAGGLGQYLCRDTRPARVRLTEQVKRNEDQIAALTAKNDELRAALAELDAHPAIEKISDILRKLLPALLFCLVLPSLASAQTPVIASTVKAVFTASPDHATVVEGNPLVLNYILDTITMTRPVPTGPLVGGALALSIPLGKPTPDASNTITVAVPTLFSGLSNGVYTSTVTAVGPGGATAVSPMSDPFVRLGSPRPAGKPSVGQ